MSNILHFQAPSLSTQKLEELQRRIPGVGDKAIIDLINGIQVSKDIICYRKSSGFFGNIFSNLDGSNNKRQILLDGNLINGQEALYNWVLELMDSLRISQVALKITQNSLLETRDAIRSQKQRLQDQESGIIELSEYFNQLAQQVGIRLSNLESRLRKLELGEDLRRIVSKWTSGTTYTNLPWAIQVCLLAREVFNSVIIYELEKDETSLFRQDLVNAILTHTGKDLPKNFFGLGDLLDQSWATIPTDEDRQLTASLLEVRSIPRQRLINIPYLFIVGTTLELATLPQEVRPSKPAQSAIALCRSQIDTVSRTTDAREFITKVVEETANDSLSMIQ